MIIKLLHLMKHKTLVIYEPISKV